MSLRLLRCVAVAAAVIGSAAAVSAVRAGDVPTAMLIVDGSGSMWARLAPDNKPKIDVVREKLATVLQTPSSTRVGLVSFGHRRRGDCNDVELITPPDSARDALLGPLAKLNPRGPGPVTAALKMAAEAIGASRPAQIVIVGDGADNCQQDNCAAANDFAKSAPGVAVHVIGIGIPASNRPRIACVAQATGGHYYDVADSNGLNAALDEATKLAILAPGAPGATAKNAEPAAPPPPKGATLRASASLAKGSPLLTVPMRWRIFKAGDETAAGHPIEFAEAGDDAGRGLGLARQGHQRHRAAAGGRHLRTRANARIDQFLDDRVPVAATLAAALPADMRGAAGLADIGGFSFRHDGLARSIPSRRG